MIWKDTLYSALYCEVADIWLATFRRRLSTLLYHLQCFIISIGVSFVCVCACTHTCMHREEFYRYQNSSTPRKAWSCPTATVSTTLPRNTKFNTGLQLTKTTGPSDAFFRTRLKPPSRRHHGQCQGKVDDISLESLHTNIEVLDQQPLIKEANGQLCRSQDLVSFLLRESTEVVQNRT